MQEKIVFGKPLEWCGETYEALTMDFDKLTGGVDRRLRRDIVHETDIVVLQPEGNLDYLCRAAALAAEVDRDVLEALPPDDFYAVTSAVEAYFRQGTVDGEVMTLHKAVEVRDEPVESLLFRFDDLCAQDLIAAERAANKTRNRVQARNNNVEFLSALAAKAAGMPQKAMDAMAACDHAAAVEAARDFLLDLELQRMMKTLLKGSAEASSGSA